MRALKVGSPEAAITEESVDRNPDLFFLHVWTCFACRAQYDIYTEPKNDLVRSMDVGQIDLAARLHRELALECAGGHPTVQFRTRGDDLFRDR